MQIASLNEALVRTLMALAPEIQRYLAERAAAGALDVWQTPLADLRAASYGRITTAGLPPAIFSIQDRYIPGPTADLHVRIYRPSADAHLPALVYFHGGGWVLNFLDIYDAELSTLANKSGSVVVAVNYQKAPEHPYPTPFNDCYATTMWVHKNAQSLGIDPTKIGVGGESAGANLAAAVSLKNRDLKIINLVYQLLINPCNERDFTTSSYRDYASGFGLSRQGMQWYWEQYLQGDAHDHDPYACPSTAKNFSDLPTAIIVTAECDPLKDDGIKYERLLRDAGVRTFYKEYEGMIHGFANLAAITPMAEIALSDCAEIIRTVNP
jgi:acetyl esterase